MNPYPLVWLNHFAVTGIFGVSSRCSSREAVRVPTIRRGQRAILRWVRANRRLSEFFGVGRSARFIRRGRLSSFADTQGKTPRRTWTDRGVLGHGLSGGWSDARQHPEVAGE